MARDVGKPRTYKLPDATIEKLLAIAERRTAETGVECNMTDAIKHVIHSYGTGGRSPTSLMLPDYGEVPCGTPVDASSQPMVLVDIFTPLVRDDGRFILTARGDSMTGKEIKVQDGDKLIVQKQSTAESGSTVVAIIDEKTTLKKYTVRGEGKKIEHWLIPANEIHKPIQFRPDLGHRIEGVVVAILRKFLN